MITEGLVITMLASVLLLILALKMRSLPILFISSLGWLISALQVYQQTAEITPMLLLMMVAFAQFFILRPEGSK